MIRFSKSEVNMNEPFSTLRNRGFFPAIKNKDLKVFLKIRYGILGQTMNIPGKPGRKISSLAYSVARRLVGFN